jgi:hypothetical protein
MYYNHSPSLAAKDQLHSAHIIPNKPSSVVDEPARDEQEEKLDLTRDSSCSACFNL